jgi:uncharacterized protein (TIGR03435 family)
MWVRPGAAPFAFALFLSAGLFAQTPQPIIEQKPSFEVASIKPSQTRLPGPTWSGARQESVRGITAFILIEGSYSLNSNEVIGAPAWTTSDQFDINAAFDGEATQDRLNAMMRTLLKERFALNAHFDTRELPTYRLVLARAEGRLGPQLVKAMECDAQNRARPCGMRASAGELMVSGKPIRYFLDYVESIVGRRIDDQTGLAGNFDLTLAWSRGPNDTQHPEIFTALQEQLGLKLESTRGPVKLLIIDSIEHPTPD